MVKSAIRAQRSIWEVWAQSGPSLHFQRLGRSDLACRKADVPITIDLLVH